MTRLKKSGDEVNGVSLVLEFLEFGTRSGTCIDVRTVGVLGDRQRLENMALGEGSRKV